MKNSINLPPRREDRMMAEDQDHRVHMNHCNQGEYTGCCKYGEDDRCPALNQPDEPIVYHPQRYPTHNEKGKPFKGQVFDGECNVTRCTNHGAQYWNHGTFGLYCIACARGINFHPLEPQICVRVDEKPSLDKMNEMYTAYMALFSKSQGW